MSLTLSEQLKLIDGDLAISTKSFFDLSRQAVLDSCSTFQSNHKVTDPAVDAHAHDYVLKMKSLISRFFKNDFSVIEQISRMTASNIGASTVTYDELALYTESQFMNLIKDNTYSAMESIATICHEEKNAYNYL